VGEPYSLLKYDQVVHTYCYTVIALLLWPVVTHIAKPGAGHKTLVFLTVLAATGIGGINEIIEFSATVLVPDTNVGNYENNAIDIVANLIGALLAVPFLKRKQVN
jgi:putative membrane protein